MNVIILKLGEKLYYFSPQINDFIATPVECDAFLINKAKRALQKSNYQGELIISHIELPEYTEEEFFNNIF